MARLILVAGLAVLLAACGEASQGFQEGFDKKFHESFVSSCVKSATQAGADAAVAEKHCSCASDKIRDRYSVSEKMKLKSEQILPLVQECRNAAS